MSTINEQLVSDTIQIDPPTTSKGIVIARYKETKKYGKHIVLDFLNQRARIERDRSFTVRDQVKEYLKHRNLNPIGVYFLPEKLVHKFNKCTTIHVIEIDYTPGATL